MKRYHIYDPRKRCWLTEAGTWTTVYAEAYGWITYPLANVARQVVEREGAYGDYELYVTTNNAFDDTTR